MPLATQEPPLSAPEPIEMAKSVTLPALLDRARAAAMKVERSDAKIGWKSAQALAPWPADAPAAFERPFRVAFAEVLVQRAVARPRVKSGTVPKTGGATRLMRRLMSATPEEFAEQDRRAVAAGLSWSTWARRRLAE